MPRRSRLVGCQITIEWFLLNKSIGTTYTATARHKRRQHDQWKSIWFTTFSVADFLVAGFFWLLLIWKKWNFNSINRVSPIDSVQFDSFRSIIVAFNEPFFFLRIHRKWFSCSVHLVGVSHHTTKRISFFSYYINFVHHLWWWWCSGGHCCSLEYVSHSLTTRRLAESIGRKTCGRQNKKSSTTQSLALSTLRLSLIFLRVPFISAHAAPCASRINIL